MDIGAYKVASLPPLQLSSSWLASIQNHFLPSLDLSRLEEDL